MILAGLTFANAERPVILQKSYAASLEENFEELQMRRNFVENPARPDLFPRPTLCTSAQAFLRELEPVVADHSTDSSEELTGI